MSVSPFPGTRQERDALLAAIRHACTCDKTAGDKGPEHGRCGAHGLLRDEIALRQLVFYRRWQLALRRAEWLEAPRWAQARPNSG